MIQYTLDQIISFCLAAEHHSFAGAARASGKDRTTLSEHVNNLEIALNVILFERRSNKLVITEQGEQLLRLASGVVRQVKGLQSYAEALSAPEKHHFRIALDANLPDSFVVNVDKMIKDSCPDAKVDWLWLGRGIALSKLMNSELDAVIIIKNNEFMRLLPPAGISGCYLGKLSGKVYTSIDSQLQELAPVKFRDLLYDTRYVLQSTFEAGLADRASYSGHQVVLGSIDLIIKFLDFGGWAFLPTIEDLDKHPNIKVLEADFLNPSWPIEHVLMSRDNISGGCFDKLIDNIKLSYRQLN